jgi:hypothetical protein
MIDKANEAARYNEGKVRYSFIDFNMWSGMQDAFNIVDKDNDRASCIKRILTSLSSITSTDRVDVHRYQLRILQAASYRLALHEQDLEFYDSDIPDLRAFEPMARVLEFGANKYERNNWRKGYADKFSTADSLYRHLRQMIIGNEPDEESGLPHIGHLMCNVMFLTNDLLYVNRA